MAVLLSGMAMNQRCVCGGLSCGVLVAGLLIQLESR